MKRSKEYIEDFEDLRKKDLTKYWKIIDKYGAFGPLPDPNGPFDAERSGEFDIYFGTGWGSGLAITHLGAIEAGIRIWLSDRGASRKL
jgi:hypothetical protein